jgi:hypothetical protein
MHRKTCVDACMRVCMHACACPSNCLHPKKHLCEKTAGKTQTLDACLQRIHSRLVLKRPFCSVTAAVRHVRADPHIFNSLQAT